MSQNRENYDLGRDPNDVDLFLERKNKMSQNKEELETWSYDEIVESQDFDHDERFTLKLYATRALKIKDKEIANLEEKLHNSIMFHCPKFLTNDSGTVSCHHDFQKEINKLKFMIDNGLGREDLKQDIK